MNKKLLLYILYICIPFAYISAQTPGGINTGSVSVEYWLRADELQPVLPNNGDDVTEWRDLSGNANRSFYSPTIYHPRFKKAAMNFHSAVNFYNLVDAEEAVTAANSRSRKLVSNSSFSPNNTRSYFAIIVSALDPNDASSTNATVFSLNRNNATSDAANTSFGWRNNGTSWFALSASDRLHNVLERQYGIGVYSIPNTTSTTTRPQIHINGLINSTNLGAGVINTGSFPSIIGNANFGTNGNGVDDYFFGDVLEIIILSKSGTGTYLTSDELSKIHSALAIKYGITLNSQTNYVLSNGTSIYNSSAGGYFDYNQNIFGIARDDASGLFQKQSKSTDKDGFVVYLGNLAETNKENTDTSLANLNALIFGSNGSTGFSNYTHNSGTAFQNYTLQTIVDPVTGVSTEERMSQRSNMIHRAKTTGATSFTVNINVASGWEWVLVSNSSTFTPNTTRVYKVNNGHASNVLINDGDYIAFAKFQQNPAAVNSARLEYWLRGDDVTSVQLNDGDEVTSWTDHSSYGRNFYKYPTAFSPRYAKVSMNYHSAVDFYYDEDNTSRRRNLQSEKVFPIEAGRTYYVVQVSRLDTERSDDYSVVINLTADTDNDNGRFGWRKAGTLYALTNGSATSSGITNLNKAYGIGLYKVDAGATNGTRQLFNDALNVETSTSARLAPRENSISVLGGENHNGNGSSYYFYGELSEVIVLSTPVNSQLSNTDLKKLNSYLALKYGLTLNEAQTDYILSDGTVVYNSASSGYTNYNKDIFGIVRDNDAMLHQKQSTSSDNAALTVYLGDLANTNAENTNNSLHNKDALMFGANGASGFTTYAHDVGTAFQNYTLSVHTDPVSGVVTEERLSLLYNYKLRAKTTGKTSFTVNINSGQGEWILVSSDPNFAPANTRIHKLVKGNTNDVLINDGDYIGFTSYLKAPAGVANGLVMWLNASKEETLTLNGAGEVTNWTDYSGFGTQFSKINSSSTTPLYVECEEKMNFHPAVYFRKSREYLSTRKGPFSVAAPNDYSFFTALNANFNTSNRIYFTSYGALTRSLYPALGVRTGSDITEGRARIYDGGGSGAVNGSQILFKAGATTVVGHTMKKNSYFRFYADAYMENFNRTTAGRNSRLNGPGTLGIGGASDSRTIIGHMSEHIAYESDISQADRDKIDSYLGLKYAITIDKNKTSTAQNFNFTFSDGSSVWNGDAPTHQNYHNNIAALIRDDVSDLQNRQAKSTDIGSLVHMGVGKKLGCEPDLDDIILDKTSLAWGHNNQPLSVYTFTSADNFCGEFTSKINGRIWLADNTNFQQSVLLSIGGPTFPYNGAGYEVYLLIADSPSKFASNNWDQVIPMTYVDGKHQVNYKFQNKLTYFTFAGKMIANCEGCQFSGIKTLDFSRTNWPTNGEKGPKNFNLGDDFNVRVTVSDPSNQMSSRYPRSSSNNSLRERRRGMNPITTTINFTDYASQAVSAATSFEIYDIDRSGSRLDNVQILGYCDGSIVYPRIDYAYAKPQNARFVANPDGTANAKPRGVNGNGNSSYLNTRNRAIVEFDNPVERIEIVYTTNSTSSSTTYIGISKMEFYCPVPPPPPNEDGLIFTKQATPEVLLCEQVDYAFRIYNTNCADKPFTFTDTLPEGMTWVNNSFIATDTDLDGVTITGYGTRTLTVSGLSAPGGATPYILRAKAIFDMDAAPGTYLNQASINYDRLGTNITLPSTDRFTGEPMSKTIANASDRPKPIETTLTTNKSCFNLNGEIEITLTIKNENPQTLEEALLNLEFDSTSFTFVDGSISSSADINLPANTGDTVDGSLEFDEFDIPTGTHWVRYRIKASDNMADFEINPTTLLPQPTTLSFDLSSGMNDICLSNTTANSSGELELRFCSFCTQEPTGGSALTSNTGISTFKDQFENWPEEVPNGFLVLESGKKGMVLTRTTPDAIGASNWVKGMIIFDTTAGKNCISIYNGTEWKCIERACNE